MQEIERQVLMADIINFNTEYTKFGQKASDHMLFVKEGKLAVREKPNWFLRFFASPFSKERSNYLLHSGSNLVDTITRIKAKLLSMPYDVNNANDIAKYVKNVNAILKYVRDKKSDQTISKFELTMPEPENPQARKEYGSFLRQQGELDKAYEQLAEASVTAPTDASILAELGEVCRLQGNIRDAARYLRAAGYRYKEQNKLDLAATQLIAATAIDKKDASVWANLGHIFLLKSLSEVHPGQASSYLDRAKGYLEYAITLDPKNADALTLQSEIKKLKR
jgi:tetratricopeptide (TPR) repeat protein